MCGPPWTMRQGKQITRWPSPWHKVPDRCTASAGTCRLDCNQGHEAVHVADIGLLAAADQPSSMIDDSTFISRVQTREATPAQLRHCSSSSTSLHPVAALPSEHEGGVNRKVRQKRGADTDGFGQYRHKSPVYRREVCDADLIAKPTRAATKNSTKRRAVACDPNTNRLLRR